VARGVVFGGGSQSGSALGNKNDVCVVPVRVCVLRVRMPGASNDGTFPILEPLLGGHFTPGRAVPDRLAAADVVSGQGGLSPVIRPTPAPGGFFAVGVAPLGRAGCGGGIVACPLEAVDGTRVRVRAGVGRNGERDQQCSCARTQQNDQANDPRRPGDLGL